MLTSANEIGGISTCSDKDRRALAKKSQSWREVVVFGGKKRSQGILVDHLFMVESSLFPLNRDTEQDGDADADVELDRHEEDYACVDDKEQDKYRKLEKWNLEHAESKPMAREILNLQTFFRKRAKSLLWAFLALLFILLNK